MSKMFNILDQLVELSRNIADHLEDVPDASLDHVEDLVNRRGRLIEELEPMTDNIDASSFPEQDQKQLAAKFRNYRSLHTIIQPALEKMKNDREELLGEAYKKRKAEDRYHFLETPDISYFTDKQ